MGLSSSQARLLNLTSRMHQIEYKAAKLEAMKLQMANESTRVYEDYLNALEKTKVQVKAIQNDGSVTYRDLSNYGEFLSAGYALVVNGNVCSDVDTLRTQVSAHFKIDITNTLTNNFETLLTNLINSGDVTIVQRRDNGFPVSPKGDDVTMDQILYFTECETSIATNTGLQEVSDEIELKKAEAKYEADMKRIDMKDRRYDQDLAALDNERNAIKQEMETLKTVAKDNVERTFKLFS